MMKRISKNGLVKNTLILIIGNMFIKILALLNRIILTRLLGNEGISLYMITLPSVMLFISLGSLSLNIAVTKIVAQKRNAGIINKALKIALISSAIVSIIMLIIAKPLAYDWLKQPKIFYPIILAAPLILLSAINSVLRGYYNGIKKVNITTTSILIEQIFRIALAAVMIYMFIDKGIVIAVSISIVAMSFGEIASIVYTSLMLRKYKQEKKNDCTYKEILDAALPITATRLFGNVTYFLEPIIFTLSLTILNYDSNNILYLYSETTAYSIPLITMFSFISYALASAIIPYVASADKKQIANYISKSIFYSLLTAIPITIILIIYAKQFMYLIYNTTIGSENVTKYCIFFIFYYIQAPLVSIMQATNHSKKLLTIIAINDILKLILIFSLPFVIKDSLMIAFIIPLIFISISLLVFLYNKYKFKFTSNEIMNLIIISVITIIFSIIVKVGNLNYLLATLLILIVFFLSTYILNVFRFRNV